MEVFGINGTIHFQSDRRPNITAIFQAIVGISVFYNIIFTIMRIAFEQLEAVS